MTGTRTASGHGSTRRSCLSGQERLTLAKRLDRARTVPAQTFFALQFPFAKKQAEDEAAPAAEGEAATAVAAAPAKPLTKGDLLAKIQEIAEAKAKEKEDAARPRRRRRADSGRAAKS